MTELDHLSIDDVDQATRALDAWRDAELRASKPPKGGAPVIVADLFAKLGLKTDRASFKSADRLIGGIKAAVGGLIAFKSIQWAAGVVNETVELGSKFVDLAAQTGVAIQPLQELAFAASQSGSDVDSLASSVGKLSKLQDAAARGGKEQRKVFKSLGVAYRDASGNLRPTEAVLGDIAEVISKMPDGPKKTATAMRAFGRSGAQLIPLLNEGRGGIDELRKRFIALGGQIDGHTAKSLEGFGDQVGELKVAWQGFKNQVVIALLPHLRALATRITDWTIANRALIKERLREYAARVVEAAQKLWVVLGQVWEVAKGLWPEVQKIVSWLGSLIEKVGGAESAIKLMVAAWVGFKALQVVSSIASIAAALIPLIAKLYAVATAGAAASAALPGGGVMNTTTKLGTVAKLGKYAAGAGMVGLAAGAGLAVGAGADWLTGKVTGRSISDRWAGAEGDDRRPIEEMRRQKRERAAMLAKRAKQAEMFHGASDYFRDAGNVLAGGSVPVYPTPAAPAVNVAAPRMHATISVQAAPGDDGNDIARKIELKLSGFWDSKMRDLAAATGGG